jgi:hypothetical protein
MSFGKMFRTVIVLVLAAVINELSATIILCTWALAGCCWDIVEAIRESKE